jgi:hypothetical protein
MSSGWSPPRGITQPAVSQHLRVLREAGFAQVRPDGTRRIYSLDPAPLREVDAWLDQMRAFWEHRLEALATEVARGKRNRATRKNSGASRLEATPRRAPAGRTRR